jgi:VWFA-related protein
MALSLLALLALAPPPAPSALELLEQSHHAYGALTSYADSGEMAVETSRGGETRFRFETRYSRDAASFVLERLGSESPDTLERAAVWALWRDASGVFLYEGKSDTYRAFETAEAALVEMLGTERRAAALVALELLAPDAGLLALPLAASVAGTVDCDGRRCWSIDFTPAASPARVRAEIDTATRLVRSVSIELDAVDVVTSSDDVAAALVIAKKRGRADEASRILVRYEPAHARSDGVKWWTPPATATLVEPGSSPPEPTAAGEAAGEPTREAVGAARPPDGRVFGEEIDVRAATVSVRVIDSSGRAIPGLDSADFKVSVGGEPATVESVDWISPTTERFTEEELAELARSGVTVPSPGRLIVLFVQTDIHPARAPGHLRLLPEIRKLLHTFHPEDEVAVVSFDSHLKLRLDFTRDLEIVDDAVWRGIRTGREEEIAPGLARPGRFPSLARHFDFEAASRAASPEQALRVVGEALLPLPGEKIMIYAGWGLGDYFAGTVTMTTEYDDAREALARARVTVFVLDVTQADYHSLEVGLETIAEDTGGTYEKTFRQPRQMTARLAHTLEGYYEIGFSVPETVSGRGKVNVELVGRSGTVLLRPMRLKG